MEEEEAGGRVLAQFLSESGDKLGLFKFTFIHAFINFDVYILVYH
jgi:hypothetical protein